MVIQKKQKAILLRKKGYSYQEIIKKIKVAKSTLSDWVNQELDKNEAKIIKEITVKKGLQKIIQINKLRSIKIHQEEKRKQIIYSKKISKITTKELFWLSLGLYMAEGAKTDRWKSIFYNSDPVLNKIMIKFFRVICHAPEERIHIQLILHKNISENKAVKFWSKELSLPIKRFNKASFVLSKASKKLRPKNRLPYGTVQIVVGNKKINNKIKGWILGVNRLFT